VPAIY
jgi:hypothetical protein